MFKDLPEGKTHFVGDGCTPKHPPIEAPQSESWESIYEKEKEDLLCLAYETCGREPTRDEEDFYDALKSLIARSLQDQIERIVDRYEGLKKEDITLKPDFYLTPEYRLGELRGYNRGIDDAISATKEEKR